jgi:hypothetical protein
MLRKTMGAMALAVIGTAAVVAAPAAAQAAPAAQCTTMRAVCL